MFFEKRRYTVRGVNDPAELARLLTQHTWTLCTGFAYGGALFLNDSTCEDGAAEFAVCTPDGYQIESVTFGWMDEAQAIAFLVDTLPTILDGHVMHKRVPLHIASYQDHHSDYCSLCA